MPSSALCFWSTQSLTSAGGSDQSHTPVEPELPPMPAAETEPAPPALLPALIVDVPPVARFPADPAPLPAIIAARPAVAVGVVLVRGVPVVAPAPAPALVAGARPGAP